MQKIIETLLEEVDPDIKAMMLKVEEYRNKSGYKNWELLTDPTGTILRWQEMRDRKRQ